MYSSFIIHHSNHAQLIFVVEIKMDMNEQTPVPRKSNRETVVLLIVLGVGLAGLAGLYFFRQSAARAAERALLQAKSNADARNADPQASRPIAAIPGNLLRSNTDSEAGTPYTFQMTNFAQGAIYEIDPGDGASRQPFVEGKLRYTYRKPGNYTVRLYARYQGQEAVIDTMIQKVGQPLKIQAPATLYND